MANKSVFAAKGSRRTAATAVNKAGGSAYDYDARHKLAQLAVTGTFGDLFYVDALPQVSDLVEAAAAVDEEFLAKVAIYARTKGKMKDTPAFLAALLSTRDPQLFSVAFRRVIDNGRMLRTFAQIMRSGQAGGRTSLGSRPKREVADWLINASDIALLRASVGNAPSLADVIRMAHPKPKDERRSAFLAWLIGKPADTSLLPKAVQDWLALKANGQGVLPDVPFQMLTSLPLGQRQWTKIAERGGWQMLRMNLNTFARHGVFEGKGSTQRLAARLSDAEEITRARVLPYQLLVTSTHLDARVPVPIREALDAAMEKAIDNVPSIDGRVVVCPDVSGSMGCPVTGWRKGASSAVRCIDVAALIAAAIVRKNPGASILPFDGKVHDVKLDPRDRVAANARILAGYGGGSTDCSAPLARLNRRNLKPDLVVFVSDNQSWYGRQDGWQTGMVREWGKLKRRHASARMVCIDIAPYGTAQIEARRDVMNIGGFSDDVFGMISDFANGETAGDALVRRIEEIEL
ncbi:MAG: RNA-binding protein [Pseudomonadota bacterium]